MSQQGTGDNMVRVCPNTGQKASPKTTGFSTSSSTVCSECDTVFGISPENVQTMFRSHYCFNKSVIPVSNITQRVTHTTSRSNSI